MHLFNQFEKFWSICAVVILITLRLFCSSFPVVTCKGTVWYVLVCELNRFIFPPFFFIYKESSIKEIWEVFLLLIFLHLFSTFIFFSSFIFVIVCQPVYARATACMFIRNPLKNVYKLILAATSRKYCFEEYAMKLVLVMTLMILGHDVAVVAITKDGHTYASNNAVSIKSDWNQNRRGECICPEMPNTKECDCTACLLHNSTWLAGKCCIYRGIPASLLAFERDDLWIPRINEYNACTGARIQLTYNGRDGQGDEEAMEADLRSDVGVRYQRADGSIFETNGAGIASLIILSRKKMKLNKIHMHK